MFGDLLPRMTEKERVLKMIKTTPDTMTLVRSLTSDEGIKESLENITAKPSKENVISFMESLPIIEQEGNRIVNFMPKDIATLYKLYFDQAAKMVNRYIKYIKKEEMNKTDLLEQVELFIIEYCNNSIKFANDLDRYLALMQDYTKTKLVPPKSEHYLLHQVLSSRQDNGMTIDKAYKKEKYPPYAPKVRIRLSSAEKKI